eukprot:Rhum_TRINITY_DN9827_c1_g1::Rhum_TRINITY_DN9827_c1_g1_i1::g.35558::m.35558
MGCGKGGGGGVQARACLLACTQNLRCLSFSRTHTSFLLLTLGPRRLLRLRRLRSPLAGVGADDLQQVRVEAQAGARGGGQEERAHRRQGEERGEVGGGEVLEAGGPCGVVGGAEGRGERRGEDGLRLEGGAEREEAEGEDLEDEEGGEGEEEEQRALLLHQPEGAVLPLQLLQLHHVVDVGLRRELRPHVAQAVRLLLELLAHAEGHELQHLRQRVQLRARRIVAAGAEALLDVELQGLAAVGALDVAREHAVRAGHQRAVQLVLRTQLHLVLLQQLLRLKHLRKVALLGLLLLLLRPARLHLAGVRPERDQHVVQFLSGATDKVAIDVVRGVVLSVGERLVHGAEHAVEDKLTLVRVTKLGVRVLAELALAAVLLARCLRLLAVAAHALLILLAATATVALLRSVFVVGVQDGAAVLVLSNVLDQHNLVIVLGGADTVDAHTQQTADEQRRQRTARVPAAHCTCLLLSMKYRYCS